MVDRPSAWVCMSSVKMRKLLRPPSFAQYMAASAFLISVAPSAPCSGNMLMPRLQLILTLRPSNGEVPRQRLHNALRRAARRVRVLYAAQYDDELIAANTRHRVLFPRATLQPFGHALQQQVAELMAQRIVMDLESVQIQKQHRNPLLWRRAPASALSSRSCSRARRGSPVNTS